jgi:hypothetical protein
MVQWVHLALEHLELEHLELQLHKDHITVSMQSYVSDEHFI